MPSNSLPSTSPDYIGLVRFLISPFLEDPDRLNVDIEQYKQNERLWIRLALDEADKGKVFGRGGRNLQAIRSILETAARGSGRSIHLEVYEEEGNRARRPSGNGNGYERRPNQNRRPPRSAPRRPNPEN